MIKLIQCVGFVLVFACLPATARDVFNLDFKWLHEQRAAEWLYEKGEYAAAVEALDAVAATAPDELGRVECLSLAAIALAHSGDFDGAAQRAAALEDPQYSRYTRLIVLSVADRHGDIITEFAEDDIGAWPGEIRPNGFQVRGEAYQDVNRPTDAIADYERAANCDDASLTTQFVNLNRMGALYRSLDDRDNAKAAYRRIVAICSNEPRPVSGSSSIYPGALLALSAMMVDEERYAEAVDYLESYNLEWGIAMSLTVLDACGDVYLLWGKPDEALKAYQEGLDFALERKTHSRAPGFIEIFERKIAAITDAKTE